MQSKTFFQTFWIQSKMLFKGFGHEENLCETIMGVEQDIVQLLR